MRKTLHLYLLTDALGNHKCTVVNDPSDNGCIGGIGKDGQYHQYDSYELWHAYDWATQRGMTLTCITREIDIPDTEFPPKVELPVELSKF